MYAVLYLFELVTAAGGQGTAFSHGHNSSTLSCPIYHHQCDQIPWNIMDPFPWSENLWDLKIDLAHKSAVINHSQINLGAAIG